LTFGTRTSYRFLDFRFFAALSDLKNFFPTEAGMPMFDLPAAAAAMALFCLKVFDGMGPNLARRSLSVPLYSATN
jgi:hypothetical protein